MRVLVLHEKHGMRVLDARDIEAACRKVVQERLDQDWYQDEVDMANVALTRGECRNFLIRRRSHEYEMVDILPIEAV